MREHDNSQRMTKLVLAFWQMLHGLHSIEFQRLIMKRGVSL